MISLKTSARLFGIFSILSFFSYATGLGLMDIVQDVNITPNEIIASKCKIIVGGVLIVIFHTMFNLGLLALMFNVIKSFYPFLSRLYFIFGFFGTIMLALGAVFLMLPIAGSEIIVKFDEFDLMYFQTILLLCSKVNFYSYQFGMAIWGFGGIILCYVIFKYKITPYFFPLLGYFGYPLFILGTVLEIYGYSVGVMLSLPGGLFEIGLSLWLIVKGFRMKSY